MKASGHFFSKKEIEDISKEFTNSLFQAVALHHPVKIVTPVDMVKLEDGKGYIMKDTNRVFYESHVESKDSIARFTTLPEVRATMTSVCADFLTALHKTWEDEYGNSVIYLLDNFSAYIVPVKAETYEDQKLKIRVYACIAGDLTSGERFRKSQETVSMVQQSEDQAGGVGVVSVMGELDVPMPGLSETVSA